VTEHLRVVRLAAENVKRLKAVDITPDGNVVVIAGRNAQGKSSVLDAIWYALGGAAASKDTPNPVRDGQDEASVTVDLGRFIVTRTWKADKTTLKVTASDGAAYKSPQTMLDDLIGDLSFDPLAFANAPSKEQRARLLSVVDLPFNLDDLDAERANVFALRTDANRAVKELSAVYDSMPVPSTDLPDQPLSVTELAGELSLAASQERDADRARAVCVRTGEKVERLRRELDTAELEHAEALKAEAALPPAKDASVIRERLEQADAINTAIAARTERQATGDRLQASVRTAAEHSARIEAIDAQKQAALTAATMPIPGLGFDADGVTYNGIPLAQVSAAERLRVSVAMAMSLNPTVRVIRITDGSLLDSDNMTVIADLAEANDFQVWIERVDESGDVGIVIEDGAIA
jgi:ATPase subunit of ABC transporter with duplicated ATPase domains